MTDIVIPLIHTTYDNHLELKYALRSMQANLIGVGKLIIVGYCPKWCKPDVFIEHPDANGYKQKDFNIFQKVNAALDHVGDQFIYANDDHFLLRKQVASKFPVYYSTTWGGRGIYYTTRESTAKLIGHTLNYDVHCPILIDKLRWMQAMPAVWPPYGYCMKTLYAQGLPGVECDDLKIRNPGKYSLEGRDWFSTDNGALKGKLLREVNKLWPNKSKWEI